MMTPLKFVPVPAPAKTPYQEKIEARDLTAAFLADEAVAATEDFQGAVHALLKAARDIVRADRQYRGNPLTDRQMEQLQNWMAPDCLGEDEVFQLKTEYFTAQDFLDEVAELKEYFD